MRILLFMSFHFYLLAGLVEAVQHVYLTNIPVWFGLLDDIKDGCTRPVVSVCMLHQMVPVCSER